MIIMLLVFNWRLSLSNMNTSWVPWELITTTHPQSLLPYFQLWFPAFPLHNYLQQTSGQQKHLFSALQRRVIVMGPIVRSLPRDGSCPHCCLCVLRTAGRGKNKHYKGIAAFVFRVPVSPVACEPWIDLTVPLAFPCANAVPLCPQAEARPRLTEQP